MDTINILTPFLNAGGKPVSGGKLAAELGVTRVSIWSRLEQLRQEGFVFDASPRVGYTLVRRPEFVHPTLLSSNLMRLVEQNPKLLKQPLPVVHCFDVVDSTNNEAVRRLGDGETAPFVVAASSQTMGRGRLGRIWDSRHKRNLYLSFAFRPNAVIERMQMITLIVGLRLCARLSELYKLDLKIKWPNDIMCGDRKIAGILTEARVDSDQIRDIVLGIGLNVNSHMDDFPFEIREIAGTLALAANHSFDINDVAADTILAVVSAYESFTAHGKGSDFDSLWKKHDYLAGKTVTTKPSVNAKSSTGTTGVVQGIDSNGCLVLRDEAGSRHTFNAGEVTLAK